MDFFPVLDVLMRCWRMMDIVITENAVRLGRYTRQGCDVDTGGSVNRERDSIGGIPSFVSGDRIAKGCLSLLRRFYDES
jgi:hypothetical protein